MFLSFEDPRAGGPPIRKYGLPILRALRRPLEATSPRRVRGCPRSHPADHHWPTPPHHCLCSKTILPSRHRIPESTPEDHVVAFFGNGLPAPLRVPSAWFLTTSTACSSESLRVYCNTLPTIGFATFPPLSELPRDASLPFEVFPPYAAPDTSPSRFRARFTAPNFLLGLLRPSRLCSTSGSVAVAPVSGCGGPLLPWACLTTTTSRSPRSKLHVRRSVLSGERQRTLQLPRPQPLLAEWPRPRTGDEPSGSFHPVSRASQTHRARRVPTRVNEQSPVFARPIGKELSQPLVPVM